MQVRWMCVLSIAAPVALMAAPPVSAQSYDLIQAAKEEGTVTTIALPHDWCGYGDIIQAFTDKYGIEVNETAPEASSADQLDAIRASAENAGPDAPDVSTSGLSFARCARRRGSRTVQGRHLEFHPRPR